MVQTSLSGSIMKTPSISTLHQHFVFNTPAATERRIQCKIFLRVHKTLHSKQPTDFLSLLSTLALIVTCTKHCWFLGRYRWLVRSFEFGNSFVRSLSCLIHTKLKTHLFRLAHPPLLVFLVFDLHHDSGVILSLDGHVLTLTRNYNSVVISSESKTQGRIKNWETLAFPISVLPRMSRLAYIL